MSLIATYLFRFGIEPAPVRLWPGVGRVRVPVDDDYDGGEVYLGAGPIKSMPSFRLLTNGKAERVAFELFSQHQIAQALAAVDIRGVEIDIGLAIKDGSNQIEGPVNWCWNGTFDSYSVRQTQAEDTTTFSATSGDPTRKRANLRRWTDAAHQARHPGDLICNQMAGMTMRKNNQPWPSY